MLTVCVVIDRFAIACERARLPHLEDEPLVLADSISKATIRAVSDEAARFGVARLLTQLAQEAAAANDTIQAVRMNLMDGVALEPGQDVNSALLEAQEATERIRSASQQAAGIHATPSAFDSEIDFFQLDTPDTRLLLAKLQECVAIAERVDAARGRTVGDSVPLGPGESRGTDLAEAISMLTLRVQGEVHGAPGKGLE